MTKHAKSDKLIAKLATEFPVLDNHQEFSAIFPFCNEYGFQGIIKNLKKLHSQPTEQLKAVLLFGESNFLSLLPYLEKIADVVILADANPHLHHHTKYLVECLQQSNTPEAFKQIYGKDKDRIAEFVPQNSYDKFTTDDVTNWLFEDSISKDSLAKYHFLANQQNFDQSKKALQKLPICRIHLNLEKAESSAKLNTLLKELNARLVLCNFTNIHHYVEPKDLETSITALLKDSPDCLVMYPYGSPRHLFSIFNLNAGSYFTEDYAEGYEFPTLTKVLNGEAVAIDKLCENPSSLFSKKQSTKVKEPKDEFCYIGYFSKANKPDEKYITKILQGSINLNFLSNKLHAHQTEKEAYDFIDEQLRKGGIAPESWDHWVFKVQGNKDRINKLLRCLGPDNQWLHCPQDLLYSSYKLSNKLVSASNHEGKVLSKDTQEQATVQVVNRRLGV